MDKGLEDAINEVNRIISNKFFMYKGEDTSLMVEVDETKRHAEFYGKYKEKGPSIKELKPILDYIHEKGYTTNLD